MYSIPRHLASVETEVRHHMRVILLLPCSRPSCYVPRRTVLSQSVPNDRHPFPERLTAPLASSVKPVYMGIDRPASSRHAPARSPAICYFSREIWLMQLKQRKRPTIYVPLVRVVLSKWADSAAASRGACSARHRHRYVPGINSCRRRPRPNRRRQQAAPAPAPAPATTTATATATAAATAPRRTPNAAINVIQER